MVTKLLPQKHFWKKNQQIGNFYQRMGCNYLLW